MRTCWLITLLLQAAPLGAQQDPPLEHLRRGQEVRLETVEGRRHVGRVTAVEPGSVVLTDGRGARHALVRDDIRRVWHRTTATAPYARRGAIAGAVAFGGYLSLLAGGLCEADSCTGEYVEGLAVGAPWGALGGALAGALLGSFVQRWEPVPETWDGSASRDTGWSLHVGVPWRGESTTPDPAALIRVAVHREMAPGQRSILEVTHIAYTEQEAGPAGAEVGRDAATWSVGLGLGRSLRSHPDVRVSASAGLARSSATVQYVGQTYSGLSYGGTVQYGTQLSAGVEAGWSPGFAPGIAVGLEARYDYVPLFFDGVQLLTLSLAIRG